MDKQIIAVDDYLNKITSFGFEYAPKLVGGLLVLIVGLWISKLITKRVGKSLASSSIDQSLVPFLRSLTNIILKGLVLITVMGMIGIEMTSLQLLVLQV
jgi:small conductance mechanosensitive channel